MTYQEFLERFSYNPNEDRLGKGGSATVYKAYDNTIHEFVALKIMPYNSKENFSLQKEVEMAKGLKHPNIARYDEYYRVNFPGIGIQEIAMMKYYEEGHLGDLLDNEYNLTPFQKEQLFEGILAGLSYLHNQKLIVIHRDLKPTNILIVRRNQKFIPLITDFGISKQAINHEVTHFVNTTLIASWEYAAPEQWEGAELRPGADMWSFGVVGAWLWLDGKYPFEVEGINTQTETGKTELFSKIKSLSLVKEFENIPHPYQDLLLKCLVISANDRCANAIEAQKILINLKKEKEQETVKIPLIHPLLTPAADEKIIIKKDIEKPKNLAKKTKINHLLIGAAIVLFGAAVIYWFMSQKEPLMQMVLIKPDTFVMGSTEGDADELPKHSVKLSAFSISKYEVTVGEFSNFIQQTNYQTDADKNGWSYCYLNGRPQRVEGINWKFDAVGKPRSPGDFNHPVIHVSWNDANAYCRWLSKQNGKTYRLPTEAEWEYAAGNGHRHTKFSWGDETAAKTPKANLADEMLSKQIAGEYIKDFNDGFAFTSPVGRFESNEFGLFDMTGNVWEWCNDNKTPYSSAEQTNPDYGSDDQDAHRILRGGSWSSSLKLSRVANRFEAVAAHRNAMIGFRVVEL